MLTGAGSSSISSNNPDDDQEEEEEESKSDHNNDNDNDIDDKERKRDRTKETSLSLESLRDDTSHVDVDVDSSIDTSSDPELDEIVTTAGGSRRRWQEYEGKQRANPKDSDAEEKLSSSPSFPTPAPLRRGRNSQFFYTLSRHPSHRTLVSESTEAQTFTNFSLFNKFYSSPTFLYLSPAQWYYFFVIPFFISYQVIIPLIFVLLNYINIIQAFFAALVAVAAPLLLFHVIWQHYWENNPAPYALNVSMTTKINIFLIIATRSWANELYQLLLTLLSCATYLFYTYQLSFTPLPDGSDGSYGLSVSATDVFVQLEYFLIVSFSLDYLSRFFISSNKWSFLFDWYNILDLLCFTGVAYFSFWHKGLTPTNTIYNYYLFQGPFRFARMRRAVKSLDKPVRNIRNQQNSTTLLYQWGPLRISKLSAMVLITSLRGLLYIFICAALVLACEFPCAAIASSTDCKSDLQQFHIAVYFIVISITTVGYGDIVCATDVGRMLMIFVVLGAIIQVPAELNAFSETIKEGKELEEKERKQKELRNTIHLTDQQNQSHSITKQHTNQQTFQSTEEKSNGNSRSPTILLPPPIPSHLQSILPQSLPIISYYSDDSTEFLAWAELQLLRHHSLEYIQQLCNKLNIKQKEKSIVRQNKSDYHVSMKGIVNYTSTSTY